MKIKSLWRSVVCTVLAIGGFSVNAAEVVINKQATDLSDIGGLSLDLREFNELKQYSDGSASFGVAQSTPLTLETGDKPIGFRTIVRIVSEFPFDDSRFRPVTLDFIEKPAIRAGVSTQAQHQNDNLGGGTANANLPWVNVKVTDLNSLFIAHPQVEEVVKIQIRRQQTLYLLVEGKFDTTMEVKDGTYITYAYPNFFDRKDITGYAVRYSNQVAVSLVVDRPPAFPPLVISVHKDGNQVQTSVPLGYRGKFLFASTVTGPYTELASVAPPSNAIDFDPVGKGGFLRFVGEWKP